jgi:Putative MetA-pathway of phenol degradation
MDLGGFDRPAKARGRVMPKNLPLLTVFWFFVLGSPFSTAQNSLCPSGISSDKLICVIPHVFGPAGVVIANPNPEITQPFQVNFLSTSMSPLSSAIARQAALLPLASPASGIMFIWNSAAKVQIAASDSFGPIMGERAETIGKGRVFVGFDYQYFKFDTLDGLDLRTLPVVLTQPDFVVKDSNNNMTTCSVNALDSNPPPPSSLPSSIGDCSFIRDVIKTTNRIDLKIHQFTTFITVGLTNRIDISIAIPIENVRITASSVATIVANQDPTAPITHAFPPRLPDCPSTCLSQSFSNPGTASGIGDMTLRIKGTAWKGERAALALGADVRMPTGDQLNYLGAGAYGVKPFVIWSYRSRISPHAFVGYEANGSSVIAGDISTGTKERLPSQLAYSGGADFKVNYRLTAAFDVLGQQVFQARRSLLSTSFPVPGKCDPGCPSPAPPTMADSLSEVTGTYNISNASVGIKLRPWGQDPKRHVGEKPNSLSGLLITGNALIKLNNGGLRATWVPLAAISYTF